MEHNETRFTIFGAQTHLLRPLQVGVVMLWYSGQPTNSGGQSARDERVRWSISLGRTLVPTNSSGVKTLEMIPGTSGLQIESGLFLWLSSDVGKLLQVMDVPCMGCGELDLIHGGGGHG